MKIQEISGRPSRKPRSRKEMMAYLEGHFRYDTMNSWNRSTSYAVNVKMGRISFPDRDTENAAYDWVFYHEEFNSPLEAAKDVLREFTQRNCDWGIGFNGRSSGYLVLYRVDRKRLDYRSRCIQCGQLNYKLVPPPRLTFPEGTSEARLLDLWRQHPGSPADLLRQHPEIRRLGLFPSEIETLVTRFKTCEIPTGNNTPYTDDNKCGKCGKPARVNLETPLYEERFSCKDVDQNADYAEWSMDELRDRVNLIWDFDQTVDRAVAAFVEEVQICGPPMPEEEDDPDDDQDDWEEVANG